MGSCVHGVRIGLLHDLAVDTDHTEHRARTLRGLRDAGKEQHDAQTGGERDRRAFPCHLASPRRPTGRSHGPGAHPSVIRSPFGARVDQDHGEVRRFVFGVQNTAGADLIDKIRRVSVQPQISNITQTETPPTPSHSLAVTDEPRGAPP